MPRVKVKEGDKVLSEAPAMLGLAALAPGSVKAALEALGSVISRLVTARYAPLGMRV